MFVYRDETPAKLSPDPLHDQIPLRQDQEHSLIQVCAFAHHYYVPNDQRGPAAASAVLVVHD
jgi:hypothetical protein